MILFKSPDQFIITPAIGIVRDGAEIHFNFSWLWFGLSIKLFTIVKSEDE